MPRNYSFTLPDDLETLVNAEADRRNLTKTDVMREAVRAYFLGAERREDIAALLYEIIRTRSLVLRGFDLIGKEITEQALVEAGIDADEYLAKRKATAELTAFAGAGSQEPQRTAAPDEPTTTLRLRSVK